MNKTEYGQIIVQWRDAVIACRKTLTLVDKKIEDLHAERKKAVDTLAEAEVKLAGYGMMVLPDAEPMLETLPPEPDTGTPEFVRCIAVPRGSKMTANSVYKVLQVSTAFGESYLIADDFGSECWYLARYFEEVKHGRNR